MQIQIEDVTKIYPGGVVGVRDITLHVGEGMFGLLGPNGAGKTTLMRMMATLLQPTAGDILVDGCSVRADSLAVRRMLGYLPQDFGVYPNLTAAEFLDYFAILDGIRDRRKRTQAVDGALEIAGLRGHEKRQLKTLSGGMRQRVGIAQAFLRCPQLLIVDEPTAGLDPEERIRFRSLLSEISGDRTVILSTHIVGDVETTCNDLAIIKDGSVLARSTPSDLIARVKGKVWEVVATDETLNAVRERHRIISVVRKQEGIFVRLLAEQQLAEKANPTPPTLEDAYVYLVGAENENPGR
jgi:ABC-2 type transport system ATP-binding protein